MFRMVVVSPYEESTESSVILILLRQGNLRIAGRGKMEDETCRMKSDFSVW